MPLATITKAINVTLQRTFLFGNRSGRKRSCTISGPRFVVASAVLFLHPTGLAMPEAIPLPACALRRSQAWSSNSAQPSSPGFHFPDAGLRLVPRSSFDVVDGLEDRLVARDLEQHGREDRPSAWPPSRADSA